MSEARKTSRLAGLIASLLLGTTAISSSSPTETTLCELAAHPIQFANTLVRVTGTVEVGYENLALVATNCPNGASARVWIGTNDPKRFEFARGWTSQRFVAALQSGELRGSGPEAKWESPLAVGAIPAKQAKLFKVGRHVAVVGRFDFAGDGLLVRNSSGEYSFRKAYGHLGCCAAQIVVESAEGE